MTNQQIEKELENMAVMDEQPLNEEDQALLDLIYDRLDIFQDMNDPYHEKAKDCRRILHMDDPYQDDAETIRQNKKRTLQLQSLKSTINNVVADQMLSMPEAKLLPETADMQEAADDLQDMVHYVVYCANNFENMHYRLCEDFYAPGTMVMQVAWDPDMSYGKGEIALIRWPIENFIWDPTAENIQDCRAVMKVSWHPLSWYMEHWPEEGKYVTGDEGDHGDTGMSEAQDEADHPGDEDRAMLIEYWWRTYNASTKRYTISVAYAAGGALLDVQKDVYAHGLFPFVIQQHDTIEGCLAGDGLVNELVPMMRYINRYMAYIDMNLRMSSKNRVLISRSAGVDKEALMDWENDVIEGDKIDTQALQWMQNTPFNNAVVQMMQNLQTDLKQDSGANQFTRGETTGGIVSGKAINSLIQAGGKVASMRTEQIKSFFKGVVEQIIWLMAQFYDDDRVVMITGRKGTRPVKVDTERLFGKKTKGAVNPPPYTVQIEVSSRDPQRIANQNQMFMEAYNMAAQTPFPIRFSSLIKVCNLDGKDRILPIIEADEQYNERMKALQQELEQAQMQIEQLQADKQSLQEMSDSMSNSLSDVVAQTNGTGQAPKEGVEPNPSAIVDQARNMMGVPTGAELPT